MSRLPILLSLSMLVLPACDTGSKTAAPDPGLTRRLAEAERKIEGLERSLAATQQALRDEDILVWDGPPANDEELMQRTIMTLKVEMNRQEAGMASRNPVLLNKGVERFKKATAELAAKADVAVPILLKEAEASQNPQHQMKLLEAMADVGGEKVVPKLKEILLDVQRPAPLRRQAGESLIKLKIGEAVDGIGQILDPPAEAPPFPDLYFLVYQLGEARNPEAIPTICRALRTSKDRSTRCHAANALANFASDEGVQALAEAAKKDEYNYVRVNSIRALIRAAKEPQQVIPVAEEVAKDTDMQVRNAANEVLGQARTGKLPGPMERPTFK